MLRWLVKDAARKKEWGRPSAQALESSCLLALPGDRSFAITILPVAISST
jgi:hypothetical protein